VATFLGKSNLLAGRVTGTAGADVTVEVAGGRFALPQPRNRASGESVLLGVRPEKVRMARPTDVVPDGHNRLPGVITDTCYAGVSTEYLIRTGWGQELSVFSSNATADSPLPPGTEIVMHWNPAHSFLLDRPQGAEPEPPEPEEMAASPGSRFEEVR
jgi:spermidine/putrescine transport system ATP-binding protein